MAECNHKQARLIAPQGETVAAKLGPFLHCPKCGWTSGRAADLEAHAAPLPPQ